MLNLTPSARLNDFNFHPGVGGGTPGDLSISSFNPNFVASGKVWEERVLRGGVAVQVTLTDKGLLMCIRDFSKNKIVVCSPPKWMKQNNSLATKEANLEFVCVSVEGCVNLSTNQS